MSRRSWDLVVAAALILAVLILAATALAKPPTPKAGLFEGSAEAAGAPGQSNAAFKVTKTAGGQVGVEVTITPLAVTCQLNGAPVPATTESVSSKSFKQNGKSAPLPVKNGKFSYKGAIYNSLSTSPGKAEISGTFKSPTEVVGTAKFSWDSVALVPGQSAPCESGKLTLAATHK